MALAYSTLVNRIRETVYGSEPRQHPYITTIDNAAGGGSSFTVPDGDPWEVGDIIGFLSDDERCRVTAVSGTTLTVERDIDGTGDLVLVAAGEWIEKNPRFSYSQIQDAVDDVLDELDGMGIFNIASETLAVTGDDWYDTTSLVMDEVFSVWYIDQGEIYTPIWHFVTDPANSQPQIYVGAYAFTGNVFINYRKPYAGINDVPDRLTSAFVNMATYKLLGMASVQSTHDPGKRTDRTVQGGQEGRDSYWFFREAKRLFDQERLVQDRAVQRLPKNRVARRAARYMK